MLWTFDGEDFCYGETRTKHVGVAFDNSDWILFKHGSFELVQEWYSSAVINYLNIGADVLAKDLNLISFTADTPEAIDGLNRSIETSGYIETWVQESFNQV